MSDTENRGSHTEFELSLEKIKLPNNYQDLAPVKKKQLQVYVDRPHKQDYFRICPEPAYTQEVAMIIWEEDRSKYLVAGDLVDSLASEVVFSQLFLGINKNGDYFIFDVKMPIDGKKNPWTTTKIEGIEAAKKQWVRLVSNMKLKAYEIHIAQMDDSEPTWPKDPFLNYLSQAFKDKLIDSLDHPIVKKLRGKI